MPKLEWDKSGEHFYETGTDHGVLFVQEAGVYGEGVAWNGLTAVNESPSGAEPSNIYADNIKYLTLTSAEDFGCTIEAYTYPDEWAECDGSAEPTPGIMIGQQTRKGFGFSYRTRIGNDVEGDSLGYKIHLIYGGKASPSEKSYQTVNDNPEALSFSWEVSTTPVNVTGHKPTACLTIDSTKVNAEKLAAFEEILYGSESSAARLPLPDEVITHFNS